MPAVYISKYNRFVDNIIGRINRILGKSYDPVRVKLQSNTIKDNKTNKKNQKKNNKKKGGKRKSATMTNKMAEIAIARATEGHEATEPTTYVLIAKTGIENEVKSERVRPSVENRQNKIKGKKTKGNTKRKSTNKKKTNVKSQKARATLFGLSSIRRDGDVSVNMMADHTTVKTNFIVGPLTLRVEREVNTRGAKREVKSATATTEEMHGRLNLRIVHGGAATLHSIRVLQPKQVRVDSSDNHEKTKRFMWRRSPHIAELVSQKLASATRSMLKPPPAA